MNYHFAYLVGALLFDAAWLACYLIGKGYHPQIIWGTAITTPLALTSFLFVPQYWTPPSLFDLDARFRVGIEDFLWAGAVDRKSTRLNSSHSQISYAVFCLKNKK